MSSTPIETLLDGTGFSCEAGGNWTSGKGQGIGCVAFRACDILNEASKQKVQNKVKSLGNIKNKTQKLK